MRRLLTPVLLFALLVPLAACRTSIGFPDPGPWAGISPDEAHHLDEGSSVAVVRDEQRTVVRVRGGHLWLNDDDLGPYEKRQAVHFLEDGRLTVDGETRARID